MSDIEKIINDAWENRKDISPDSDKKDQVVYTGNACIKSTISI